MAVKRNFWDILMWIAFAWVLIYAILKIMGILKSPVSIDLSIIISAAYFVGKLTQKIKTISRDVEGIKEDIKEINTKCPISKEKGTKSKYV